jgi:hypothetical protein
MLNCNPFLVGMFPGFSQNSFDKRQVTACRFKKDFLHSGLPSKVFGKFKRS